MSFKSQIIHEVIEPALMLKVPKTARSYTKANFSVLFEHLKVHIAVRAYALDKYQEGKLPIPHAVECPPDLADIFEQKLREKIDQMKDLELLLDDLMDRYHPDLMRFLSKHDYCPRPDQIATLMAGLVAYPIPVRAQFYQKILRDVPCVCHFDETLSNFMNNPDLGMIEEVDDQFRLALLALQQKKVANNHHDDLSEYADDHERFLRALRAKDNATANQCFVAWRAHQVQSVDALDVYGNSALLYALRYGYYPFAYQLVKECGASLLSPCILQHQDEFADDVQNLIVAYQQQGNPRAAWNALFERDMNYRLNVAIASNYSTAEAFVSSQLADRKEYCQHFIRQKYKQHLADLMQYFTQTLDCLSKTGEFSDENAALYQALYQRTEWFNKVFDLDAYFKDIYRQLMVAAKQAKADGKTLDGFRKFASVLDKQSARTFNDELASQHEEDEAYDVQYDPGPGKATAAVRRSPSPSPTPQFNNIIARHRYAWASAAAVGITLGCLFHYVPLMHVMPPNLTVLVSVAAAVLTFILFAIFERPANSPTQHAFFALKPSSSAKGAQPLAELKSVSSKPSFDGV